MKFLKSNEAISLFVLITVIGITYLIYGKK